MNQIAVPDKAYFTPGAAKKKEPQINKQPSKKFVIINMADAMQEAPSFPLLHDY